MARLAIPVTDITIGGASPAAQTVGDAVNNHELAANDGAVFLELVNESATPRDVTVETFAPDVDGLALPDRILTVPAATKAALTTVLAGTNNDLVFTADQLGPVGNSIRVRYVVAGLSTPLTVTVVGLDITVNVATDGAGAPTSTAAQVKTALDGDASAAALIDTANAAGNDGTGVVAALGYTNLAGGDYGTKYWGRLKPSTHNVPAGSPGAGKVYIDVPVSTTLKLRAYRLVKT